MLLTVASGAAVSGPAGNGFDLRGMTGFWFAWYAFHPDTEVYTAPE